MIGKLVLIAALVLSVVFLFGYYLGYNRGIDHGVGYAIERTLLELQKLFTKYGHRDIFEEMMKKEANDER